MNRKVLKLVCALGTLIIVGFIFLLNTKPFNEKEYNSYEEYLDDNNYVSTTIFSRNAEELTKFYGKSLGSKNNVEIKVAVEENKIQLQSIYLDDGSIEIQMKNGEPMCIDKTGSEVKEISCNLVEYTKEQKKLLLDELKELKNVEIDI